MQLQVDHRNGTLQCQDEAGRNYRNPKGCEESSWWSESAETTGNAIVIGSHTGGVPDPFVDELRELLNAAGIEFLREVFAVTSGTLQVALEQTVGLRLRLSYTPTVNMAEVPEYPPRQLSVLSRATRLILRQPRAALTVLRMTSWVALVSLAIKTLPLPRAMRLLEPRSRSDSRCSSDKSAAIASLLDSLLATNFLFLTPTCWKRAPVLRRFLALEGVETRIVFGVRREGDKQLTGHAWLEADGKPLHEPTAPEYKITFSYPS